MGTYDAGDRRQKPGHISDEVTHRRCLSKAKVLGNDMLSE